MSTYGTVPYRTARGKIGVQLDPAQANRLLLALERLDQDGGGLDPSLAQLRETIKAALVTKSSGDIDSAPSTE